MRAFDLEDFAVSPVTTVEFVPGQVQEKWAKVFSHIALALKDALDSPGPGHTRRIREALRWCCGVPQIFLRSSSRGDHHRQARHIEGRLDAFIGGNYTTLIGWWRAECERAGRTQKPRKPQSPDQRWDLGVQQIVRGFVGNRMNKGGSGGVGPTGARKEGQVVDKHPHERWQPLEPVADPGADGADLSFCEKVIAATKPIIGVGPRGLRPGHLKPLFQGFFVDNKAREAWPLFLDLGRR